MRIFRTTLHSCSFKSRNGSVRAFNSGVSTASADGKAESPTIGTARVEQAKQRCRKDSERDGGVAHGASMRMLRLSWTSWERCPSLASPFEVHRLGFSSRTALGELFRDFTFTCLVWLCLCFKFALTFNHIVQDGPSVVTAPSSGSHQTGATTLDGARLHSTGIVRLNRGSH
ncbi:hypothetical protein BCV69DRAFT_221901 [Microstroma glucosiphilum]|uniref:Uncharacterized protein n=1 Tax=Pseudomicrostroma glucosiphilum TaxID=1684307 RepID=A0A316U4Q9_9BASI|nr:hypothetical protein BCV69DRAFT_221901 [Pseudomicrostroma glucosiphilum]PWN20160.1 hypothetical protein BCV69DRAFT_221901 [Pseudomicrostroma glucosiphilum]